ncbi:hypothetical protein GCM10011514_30460 [Emticicia aquatilis]|uniref:Uncharacterized protein n=1 Tax=Emticicia aquatilis TaxID=1537369 RepID=A0A916YWI5_9BACT|nr:hypothetical protein GCM10011514_30460 [Emticicia aquatilis]
MTSDNFKLLIRNLRTRKHVKLKIQSTANNIEYIKIGKSVLIPETIKPDNKY